MPKIILLIMTCSLLFAAQVQAANAIQEEGLINLQDIPDYLGTNVVPLSPKELKALHLVGSYASKGMPPFMSGGGKLMYVHGQSVATVISAPMQVSDIELQAGEKVNEIVVGDSARWMVENGQAGETTHLFIKPVDAGLETNAVITTDRRVYHLRLISQREGFTPYIGFVYSDSLSQFSKQKNATQQRQEHFSSTSVDGQKINLADLNFNYTVKGSAPWKPERIYDNKQQTFIRLPKDIKANEMPILLVRKGKKDVLVNYRVKEQAIIVDGVFAEMVLVLGIGSSQEKIIIQKEG